MKLIIVLILIGIVAYAVQWYGSYRRYVKFGDWLGMVVFLIGMMSIGYLVGTALL